MYYFIKKFIVIIVCALSVFGLQSCEKDSEIPATTKVSVSTDVYHKGYAGLTLESEATVKKIMDKLVEFKFISSYQIKSTNTLSLDLSAYEFVRENVNVKNFEAVQAELMTEAHKQYDKAITDVNAFDFNSLITGNNINITITIGFQYGSKPYKVTIKAKNSVVE